MINQYTGFSILEVFGVFPSSKMVKVLKQAAKLGHVNTRLLTQTRVTIQSSMLLTWATNHQRKGIKDIISSAVFYEYSVATGREKRV